MLLRFLLFVALTVSSALAETTLKPDQVKDSYWKLPLHFEAGAQTGQFTARGQSLSVRVSAQEAVVHVRHPEDAERTARIRMRLLGSSAKAQISANEPLEGKINYLIGSDPRQWRRDVSTFAQVKVRGIQPGVDLLYYGNQQKLEYDFLLAPGADPSGLIWELAGMDSLAVNQEGALVLQTSVGPILWRKPEVYQNRGKERVSVSGAYVLMGKNRVGFRLGEYDLRLPLVIDPVLEYSTVLGSNGFTKFIKGIAVDSIGQAYIVGATDQADFPVANAAQPDLKGGLDAHITKLNSAGTAVIYSTFIGGATSNDAAYAIALDNANPPNAYVTGDTFSTDFPVVGGPQSTLAGSVDAFVLKLNSTGNVVLYSSYHGGASADSGRAIGVNLADGTAYIGGETQSTNLPVVNALQGTKGSASLYDGFLAKFSTNGSTRLFSTYLGGNSTDTIKGLGVDASGSVYVTGETVSSDFPNDGFLPGVRAGSDCFITKIAVNGANRIYSALLGGNDYDACFGLALDSTGAAYVAGGTRSTNFPIVGGVQSAFGGAEDMFVAKLNPAGTALVYSTYLGGPLMERAMSIAVDSAGRAHFAGYSAGRMTTLNALVPKKVGGDRLAFRSTNSGALFAPADQGLPSISAPDFPVLAFESSQIVHAANQMGETYRSTDAGVSWNRSGSGGLLSGTPQVMAAGGGAGIWVGTSSSLLRSLDSGLTWQTRVTGLPANPNITAIAFNSNNPSEVFVGLSTTGVYRSLDGGGSWSSINAGLGNLQVRALLTNPSNSAEIIAATASTLFRSANSGSSWASFGATVGAARSLFRHPVSGELFAVVNFGIYVSADNGTTWQYIDHPSNWNIAALAVDPTNSNTLMTNTQGNGIWRSTDKGANWGPITDADLYGRALAFAPGGTGVLLGTMVLYRDAAFGRLEAAGNVLSYLSYWGTSLDDTAGAIAADSSGNSYVLGEQGNSGRYGVPTTSGALQREGVVNDTFVAKVSAASPACTYQVSPPPVTLFPSNGLTWSAGHVIAPSGCPWTATSSAPWLVVSDGANRTGVGRFLLDIAPNPGPLNRVSDLVVAGTVIRMEQAGSGCSVASTFSPGAITASQGGTTTQGTLTFLSGCPWSARSVPDWVTLSPSSGVGSGQLTVTVNPSTARVARTANIRLGFNSPLTITQDGACTARFSNSIGIFGPSGGSGQSFIQTGSGCPWSISVQSSNVVLTSPASGVGPGQVTYTVPSYAGGPPRTTTISLGVSTLSVTQNGSSCVATLGSSSATVSALASTLRVPVTVPTGCGWTMTSPVDWTTLRINSNASGTADIAISANPGPGSRSATLDIAGVAYPLTQAAPVCEFGLTPSTTNFPAAGSGLSGTLSIGASGSSCTWIASSSASWLQINSPVTGAGNATLNFTVASNPSTSGRVATVTVNSQSVSFTQAGTAPCGAFSISQAAVNLPSPAGQVDIQVSGQAGCGWTVSSSVAWVTIPGGLSGSGRATVGLSVQPNPGPSVRSATITVAGNAVVITQSAPTGASCRLETAPNVVRAEGRTEPLSELVLTCTALPLNVLADLELTLNTNVTNRIAGGRTDASLSINAEAPILGQVAGYNSLRWPGVRLPGGNSVLRIRNIQVDPSLVASLASLTPTLITTDLRLNSTTPIPVINSRQFAGLVSRGLLLQTGTVLVGSNFRTLPVTFSEGFGGAFQVGTTENTRLRLVIPNIPTGVRVYAPVYPSEGASRARLFSADSNGVGGAAVPGATINGALYQEVTVNSGVGVATWQVASVDANLIENLSFPMLIQNASDAQMAGLVPTVSGTFAPVSSVAVARADALVPRFRDFGTPQRRVNLRLTSRVLSPGPTTNSFKGGRSLFGINASVPIALVANNDTEQTSNNTVVRNNLPTGLLFQSCSVPCAEANGQVTIPLGDLPAGGSREVSINTMTSPALSQGGTVSNWSTVDSDDPTADLVAASSSTSISIVPGPPAVTLPEPISGSGINKTFVLRFSNPNGFQRLGVLNALINRALDGGNACYIAYSVPAGALFLVNDRGPEDGLSGALVLGSPSSVSNSQCTINGVGSSAVGNGNDLTITLSITFSSSFSGSKIVYLAARDDESKNSGWSPSGFHQVPGGPATFPNPVEMSPSTGTARERLVSFVYEDETNQANLQTVWALVNTALDARGACYVVYFAPGNLIGLYPDNGDGAAVNLVPLAGNTTLTNSQCQVSMNGSSVTRSGARLTLSLNMTFRPAFAGSRVVYMALQTLTAVTSQWKTTGAWQVPP